MLPFPHTCKLNLNSVYGYVGEFVKHELESGSWKKGELLREVQKSKGSYVKYVVRKQRRKQPGWGWAHAEKRECWKQSVTV